MGQYSDLSTNTSMASLIEPRGCNSFPLIRIQEVENDAPLAEPNF
jgi:hypothetical protein